MQVHLDGMQQAYALELSSGWGQQLWVQQHQRIQHTQREFAAQDLTCTCCKGDCQRRACPVGTMVWLTGTLRYSLCVPHCDSGLPSWPRGGPGLAGAVCIC